jgi:RHS repeat-associated protein
MENNQTLVSQYKSLQKLLILLIMKNNHIIYYLFSFIIGIAFSPSTFAQYQTPAKNPNDAPDPWWEVGTLPGSVAVSPKGAATYTIPLIAPPGTAGMTPTLALTYNSHLKNGILGVGWAISGLSEIVRMPLNYYNDGTSDPADLQMNDAFAIDSARLLLLSGAQGADESVYATEIETFLKVTAKGNYGNGPSWFKVETKSGNTLEYGNTTDSKVLAPNFYTVIQWKINRITDPNGNYIEFIYTNSGGETVISEIRYTGNTQLSPYNKIKFNYITRNDPFFYYIGGAKVPNTKIISSIRMETEGGTLVREYYMKYHYDFYTHLNEVYEGGSSGLRYNSTVFGWGTSASAYSYVSLSTGNYLKYFQGDFNGDGIIDLLSIVRKASYTASDKWTIKLNETANAGPFQGSLSTNFKDFVVVDVNSDGKDEILWRRRQASPVAEIFENYYFSGSSLWRGDTQYDLTFTNADAGITLYPADFDGDGDMDYMSLKPDKNLDAFKGFTPTGANPSFNTPNLVQLIDFNGDKRKDILVIKGSNSYIYSYNPLTGYWETIYSSTSFPVSTDRVYTGDFNGDKKTDILYYRSGWNLKFSTGMNATGFVSSYSPPLRNYDPGASLTDNNYYIGDFNGDGKDDIVEMYKTGSSVKNIDAFYSKGDGTFLKEVNSYLNLTIDEQFFSVVDYNSDGQKDIWRYDYVTGSTTYPIVSYFHCKERRDLVQGIRDGLGVLTNISYANLNYRSYDYQTGWSYLLTRGSSETFPLQDYTGPLIVVSQSASSNGVAGLNTTAYTYTGAKIHRKGKGYLGFVKITSSNLDESVRDIIEYTLNKDYYFLSPVSYNHKALVEVELGIEKLMTDESIKKILDVSLSSNGFIDTLINYGNNRIFVTPKSISTSDYNTGQNTTTAIRFDSEGNAIYTKKQYSFFSRLDGTVIDSSVYASYGNHGIKNKITSNSVTSIYSGQQPVRKVNEFFYDSKGNLTSSVSDPDLSGALTKSLFINNYGLPDSVKLGANGVIPRVSKYIYDQKYRFIKREINPLGQYIDKTYNPGTGNIDTLSDIGGLKTVYYYDAFGKKIGTKTPDANISSINYLWDGGGSYKVITSRPHTPTSTIYYDILNREKQSEVQGQFSQIYRYKVYNTAGYLTRESPAGDGIWIDYKYDDRMRIDTVIYNGTLTTYIKYHGVVPEVHYPDSSVKKIMEDALGNILSVNENRNDTVTYTYNSFSMPETISSLGSVITFNYDNYGRQTSINNPNSGTTLFRYDNFGQLIRQTDSRNDSIQLEYDVLGRQIKVKTKERETLYDYYSLGTNTGKTKSISSNDGIFQTYSYDGIGRPVRVADSIPADNISMVTRLSYDSCGNNTSVVYPSGITINKIYDNNGYLSEIWHGSNMLWKLNSSNGRGQPVNYNLGNISNNLQVSFTYDAQGRVSGITTGQKKQTYYFDPASGNLISRDYRIVNSQTGLTEVFEYDSLKRLIKSKVIGCDSIVVVYADNGNILSKSDAGNYTYHASKVNAVTALSGNPSTVSLTAQEISYNTFNLTTGITEGDSTYQIIYNPLNQRIKTTYSIDNGATVTTRYYSGGYEKTMAGGVTKELHYISGPSGLVAIIVKQGQSVQTYYVETDHLGSIIGLINADKSYADSASFDPWGRRRDPADWSYYNVPAPQIADRGFTGHEHLDAFGLINMNGRMYDPVVARFLGVDPVIQDISSSQSFNSYSYCLNNPLIYTDPSGFFLDAESWQRSMYESGLRHRGISQSDIWLLESDQNWTSYIDIPFTTSAAAGSSYFTYYTTINGNIPLNPKRFLSGYWVDESVNTGGYIVYPDGLGGIAICPEIYVIARFVPYLSEGSVGGVQVREYSIGRNGTLYALEPWDGPRVIGGTVPLPGFGAIGKYIDLVKLTKGFKGAIQAHHLIEVRFLPLFGLSKSHSPAVILDKATHSKYTKDLFNELPRSIEHSKADVLNAYNKVYSSEPMWQEIIKAILGY